MYCKICMSHYNHELQNVLSTIPQVSVVLMVVLMSVLTCPSGV